MKTIDWETFAEHGIFYETWIDENGIFHREKVYQKPVSWLEAIEVFESDALIQLATEKLARGEDSGAMRKLMGYFSRPTQARDAEQARRRAKEANIVAVAEHLGLGPVRMGFIHSIYGPDKTPSMKLYEGQSSFWCYATQQGGDVIRFVMDFTKKSFRESVDFLQHF